MLGVLAVFRLSVLVVLPILAVVQDSVMRGAVVLAAFQGFLLRDNAGASILYKYKKLKSVSCEYNRLNG